MDKFDKKFLKHALTVLKESWHPEADECSPEDVINDELISLPIQEVKMTLGTFIYEHVSDHIDLADPDECDIAEETNGIIGAIFDPYTFGGVLTCRDESHKDKKIKELENKLEIMKIKKDKYKSMFRELSTNVSDDKFLSLTKIDDAAKTKILEKETGRKNKSVPNLSKRVKIDFYAEERAIEERAIEIEKMKIGNEDNGIAATELNSKLDKISQFELEIKNLKISNEKYKTQTKTLNKKIAELQPVYDDEFFERASAIMLKGAPTCDEVLFCEEDDVLNLFDLMRVLHNVNFEDAFLEIIGEACKKAEFREYQTHKDTVNWMMNEIFKGFRLPNKYDMSSRYLWL